MARNFANPLEPLDRCLSVPTSDLGLQALDSYLLRRVAETGKLTSRAELVRTLIEEAAAPEFARLRAARLVTYYCFECPEGQQGWEPHPTFQATSLQAAREKAEGLAAEGSYDWDGPDDTVKIELRLYTDEAREVEVDSWTMTLCAPVIYQVERRTIVEESYKEPRWEAVGPNGWFDSEKEAKEGIRSLKDSCPPEPGERDEYRIVRELGPGVWE